MVVTISLYGFISCTLNTYIYIYVYVYIIHILVYEHCITLLSHLKNIFVNFPTMLRKRQINISVGDIGRCSLRNNNYRKFCLQWHNMQCCTFLPNYYTVLSVQTYVYGRVLYTLKFKLLQAAKCYVSTTNLRISPYFFHFAICFIIANNTKLPNRTLSIHYGIPITYLRIQWQLLLIYYFQLGIR